MNVRGENSSFVLSVEKKREREEEEKYRESKCRRVVEYRKICFHRGNNNHWRIKFMPRNVVTENCGISFRRRSPTGTILECSFSSPFSPFFSFFFFPPTSVSARTTEGEDEEKEAEKKRKRRKVRRAKA